MPTNMKNKTIIDRQVALELGMSARKVAKVTTNFIAQMTTALAEDGEFDLSNFATFRVRVLYGPAGGVQPRQDTIKPQGVRRIYVRCFKNLKLKRLLVAAMQEQENG